MIIAWILNVGVGSGYSSWDEEVNAVWYGQYKGFPYEMAVALFRLMALYNSDPFVVMSLELQCLRLALESPPSTHLSPRYLKNFV